MKLIKKIEFINSYSYIYSARPGTPASFLQAIKLDGAKKRLKLFQNNADKIKLKYKKTLINKISKVLIENKVKNENKYFGRDEYFNSVIVKSDNNIVGQIKDVQILQINTNTMFGEISSNINQKDYAA